VSKTYWNNDTLQSKRGALVSSLSDLRKSPVFKQLVVHAWFDIHR